MIACTFSVEWARCHVLASWQYARQALAHPTPSLRTSLGLYDVAQLCDTQAGLSRNSDTWTQTTMVDCCHQPWRHLYLPKHQASRGMFLIPRLADPQNTIIFPLADQWIAFLCVAASDSQKLCPYQAFQNTICRWRSSLSASAIARITAITDDLVRDEMLAATRAGK